MDLQDVADRIGPAFYRVLCEAHRTVQNQLVNVNEFTAQIPEGRISGVMTDLAKVMLPGQVAGVSRADGKRAEFDLEIDGETCRFRVNRSRLRGASSPDSYTADQLAGPRGNAISANSTRRDFLVLWVAEHDEFRDVWIVRPNTVLRPSAGTQLATFDSVEGRWWSEAVRVQVPMVVDIADLHVDPVPAEIDLRQGDVAVENQAS